MGWDADDYPRELNSVARRAATTAKNFWSAALIQQTPFSISLAHIVEGSMDWPEKWLA